MTRSKTKKQQHSRRAQRAKEIEGFTHIEETHRGRGIDEWLDAMSTSEQKEARARYLCQMVDPGAYDNPVGVPSTLGFERFTTKIRLHGRDVFNSELDGTNRAGMTISFWDNQSEPNEVFEINDASDQNAAAFNKLPFYGYNNNVDDLGEQSPVMVSYDVSSPLDDSKVPAAGTPLPLLQSMRWPRTGLDLRHSRVRKVSQQWRLTVTSSALFASGNMTVVTPSNRLGISLNGKDLEGATNDQGVTFYSIPIASMIAEGLALVLTWYPTSQYNTWSAIGDWVGNTTPSNSNLGPIDQIATAVWGAVYLTGLPTTQRVSVNLEHTSVLEIYSALLPTNTGNNTADVEPHISGSMLSQDGAAKLYHASQARELAAADGIERVAHHLHETGSPFASSLRVVTKRGSGIGRFFRGLASRILPAIGTFGGALLGGPLGAAAGTALGGSIAGLISRPQTSSSLYPRVAEIGTEPEEIRPRKALQIAIDSNKTATPSFTVTPNK